MRVVLAMLLICSLSVAQAPTPAPGTAPVQTPAPSQPEGAATGAAAGQQSKPPEVAPDAVVLTLPGVCDKPVAGAECKTTVTRAEFEALVKSIAPPNSTSAAELPPMARRQIATSYASLLAVATEAERRDLEKNPDVQQLLRVSRLQAMARALTAEVQRTSAPSDAEVEQYYKANAANYESATLRRIVVPARPAPGAKPAARPKGGTAAKAPAAAAKPIDEKGLTALAQQLRTRAVAPGADLDALQKQAYDAAGVKAPVDTTVVVRRNSLAPSHQAVFDLKPGEVSQLFSEPSGHYIYRMEKKDTVPLAQAREEIVATMTEQKFRNTMEGLLKKSPPEFNDAYFGAGMSGFGTMRETPSAPAPVQPGSPAQPQAPGQPQTTPPPVPK